MSNMQVWVACLESYNNGRLHGQWVDPTDFEDAEAFGKEIDRIIIGEEYAIHDYDNCPKEIVSYLGEYASYEQLYDVATALVECKEEYGEELVLAAFQAEVVRPDEMEPWEWSDIISDCASTSGESPRDIAQEMAIDSELISEDSPMFSFIDWDRYVGEMEHYGSFVESGKYWYFFYHN